MTPLAPRALAAFCCPNWALPRSPRFLQIPFWVVGSSGQGLGRDPGGLGNSNPQTPKPPGSNRPAGIANLDL
jgi:hypothetical protein